MHSCAHDRAYEHAAALPVVVHRLVHSDCLLLLREQPRFIGHFQGGCALV